MYTGNSINETEKKLKYTGLVDGYNYIGTKDVGFDHAIDYDNGVKIPFDSDKFRIAPTNSILLCVEGGSAGRKIAFTNQDVCFGNKLCCFVSYGIDYLFLYYYLQCPIFQSAFKDNKTGIIGGVSLNTLKEMFFPVPPLAEQKRIVKQIQKIIPYILEYDKKYNEIENQNSKFPDQLKKSILQMAVQGKLVPQDENDEPASVLLERIRAEKQKLIAEGKIKKDKNESVIFRRDNSHYEKLNGVEHCIDDEIPYDIPDSWCYVRLGSVISLQSGQDLTPDKYNDKLKGIPYITGASNIENGSVIINRWTEHGRSFAYKGDLLLTCKGTVGSMAILNEDKVHIARQIMGIHSFSNISLAYIQLVIETIVEKLKAVAKSMIPGISRDDVLSSLIPIPPLKEQNRIVEQINCLLPIIETICKQ
ncbi:MAG: restriction endonuclease subunit S [Clostridia bacterium]|nr:restriction endonuclease subunit S [Clostridia bacterium]